MIDMENKRLHAVVKGHVQGVGFRFFVQKAALNLKLTGWVRNMWDSSVEVVAEGPNESLLELLQGLRKGPPSAQVASVGVEWLAAEGKFNSFHVKFS